MAKQYEPQTPFANIQQPKKDLSFKKINDIYFFILFGFSYFSDKVFFYNFIESDYFHDDKSELYFYISTKFNITLSICLIISVFAKEYIRNFILRTFEKDIDISLFLLTLILIFAKIITLILIYTFISHFDLIFLIYTSYIILLIMFLGMSRFLPLILDTYNLVFSKPNTGLKRKLELKNPYLNSLPNPVKLIIKFLFNKG